MVFSLPKGGIQQLLGREGTGETRFESFVYLDSISIIPYFLNAIQESVNEFLWSMANEIQREKERGDGE
jgi:hypothetical protein